MGVVYNPDRNTLIPISTISGEITYLTAGLIYEKMQTCLIIGTEVTYLKHYPDQDLYLADYSYMQGGIDGAIFSNRAQRDPFSYFHRWNPNTQEFVIRGGVSLNLSSRTKNGIMYYYFPNANAHTILAYDYNRLFFNNVEEIKATVRVNYYLPDYDYTYAKITYKQDSEPASETDGTSVNILKDQSSVDIEGLEEEKTYYFKIFTDKSESEAFPYTVEVDPVPPEYKTYINNINGTGFDWIKNLQSEEVSATFTDHITLTGLNMNFSPGSRTWYTNSHIGTDMEYWNKTNFSYVTSALFVSTTGIDSVNITGSNDSYTCTINKNNSDVEIYNNNGMFVYDKNMSMGVTSTNGIPRKWFANFNFNQNYLYYGNCNPFYNGSWATRTFTGTLTQVFENLQRYARNIDIYVNNELWSKAGN